MTVAQITRQDSEYMALAISLAKRGRYTTSPNPNVGCVIVKDGEIVGQGWHEFVGGPHAEVMALADAGDRAQGATCYVTLEPCSHYGRTPPCSEALIKAKVKKVIAAMVDPNPQVSGRGLRMMEEAGIETFAGLLSEDAIALNPGFLKRMRGEGPMVRLKLAASLDGKTALSNGQSKWITSTMARRDVQEYRAQSSAVISGADTVIVDNASLTVRYDELTLGKELLTPEQVRQPMRVIVDSRCRLTPDLQLFKSTSPIVLVRTVTVGKDDKDWPEHVEQLLVKESDGKADLADLVTQLAAKGCNDLWVETGARLAGAFMAADLVDELIVYQAPKLIGAGGRSLVDLPDYQQMNQLKSLQILDITRVGPDIRIVAKPNGSDK